MKRKCGKLVMVIGLIVVLLSCLVPESVMAAPNGTHATNIEIVKKVTLKGPAARGGKVAPTTATGIIGAPLPNGGQRYAIVIGINDYPGSSSDLQYCVIDAEEIYWILTNVYGFNKVELLTDASATYENIRSKIQTLGGPDGITSNDEVVFFFSGHGAKGKADDGDRNNIDQAIVVNKADGSWGYLWDGDLKSLFSGYTANRIIFIFDSCLAGGMSVLQGTNRVVNMACSINGVSYEGESWGGGHGQFTYYFAEEGMRYGEADVRPHDGKVTVEEAFDYAKLNCRYQSPVIADGFYRDLLP